MDGDGLLIKMGSGIVEKRVVGRAVGSVDGDCRGGQGQGFENDVNSSSRVPELRKPGNMHAQTTSCHAACCTDDVRSLSVGSKHRALPFGDSSPNASKSP